MHGHRPRDGAADILQHEREVAGGKEARPAHRIANLRMAEHISVGSAHQYLVGGPQWCVVQDDGQPRTLAQGYVPGNVLRGQGVLETAGDGKLGQLVEQRDHVVVGPLHGEVVMDLEPLRGDLLHRLGLRDDVLPRREVELQPRIPAGRVVRMTAAAIRSGCVDTVQLDTGTQARYRCPNSL